MEHFSPVRVTFPVNAPALRPPPTMAPPANYDAHHADDEAEGAMDKAINSLKNFAWLETELKFWFAQIEVRMKSAGVKSNFTKLQVLSTILPPKVIVELKNILQKQESEFPKKDAYLQAKTEILRTFGPGENADFDRAMGRVLSGKPSQLAKALINDLCSKELKDCCCIKVIAGLWKRALPSSVRQAVAHYDFTSKNLMDILQVADDVYESTKPPSATVAAMAVAAPPQPPLVGAAGHAPDEVLNTAFLVPDPAVLQQQTAQAAQVAQLAAIYQSFGRGGRRGGRGYRGQRGGGRGGGNSGKGGQETYSASNPRWTTPRHADSPPFGVCKRHWQFGKSSFTCLEPWQCEWKNFLQKPNKNK